MRFIANMIDHRKVRRALFDYPIYSPPFHDSEAVLSDAKIRTNRLFSRAEAKPPQSIGGLSEVILDRADAIGPDFCRHSTAGSSDMADTCCRATAKSFQPFMTTSRRGPVHITASTSSTTSRSSLAILWCRRTPTSDGMSHTATAPGVIMKKWGSVNRVSWGSLILDMRATARYSTRFFAGSPPGATGWRGVSG